MSKWCQTGGCFGTGWMEVTWIEVTGKQTSWWPEPASVCRYVSSIFPHALVSRGRGGGAWNASTQTSNRPTQVETSFVSDLCEGPDLSQLTDYTFMRFFLKLRCVWRVGIDRGVHMLTHKWRAKVCRSGVDQLMDHPLIVSGMVLLTQGSGCVSREDHQDSVG